MFLELVKYPGLCEICALHSSRLDNVKDRNKEDEEDVEKAKQLMFDAERKRKFAEDEMNQMVQ